MNDQPSNISLSSSTISENSRKGSIIGRLSTIDEDSGQIHNFTIISTIGKFLLLLLISQKINIMMRLMHILNFLWNCATPIGSSINSIEYFLKRGLLLAHNIVLSIYSYCL